MHLPGYKYRDLSGNFCFGILKKWSFRVCGRSREVLAPKSVAVCHRLTVKETFFEIDGYILDLFGD